MADLPFDLASLDAAYGSGMKPRDIVAEAYRRIRTANDPGIFIHLVDEAEALAEADALPAYDAQAMPLWGIPFAIKDNIDAAGMPTTAACPAYAYQAEADAFAVAKLRAAGAILLGKTNLDQFATGLVGVRSPYPPPLNAIDPDIVPGGSSSGSAVAVARGLVAFALGTDTAGSGRVPAALNNIVGLKPSLGAISATGVVPACRTLDTISIFALTVEDASRAFKAAAGFDPADAYSRAVPISGPGVLPDRFRVGVPDTATREFCGDNVQADSFAAVLDGIATLGGEIVAMDFAPFFRIAAMLYEGAWVAERYTVIEDLLRSDPDAVHPVTRRIIAHAEDLSAADAFRGIYRLADLKREVEPVLESIELLCVPSIPTFFSLADLEADPIGPNSKLGTYTNFVNLLGLCGVAVPVQSRSDGRPGSVTIIAPDGCDGRAATLAAALHRMSGGSLGATDWRQPDSDDTEPSAEPGEIALAAVGAHMSGLPLNRELTRLGGRFLGAAKTAPVYRLYCLAGGPPSRPGLVRSDDGASIELEIWALPESAFGTFLRGIPQPLGIGTITLDDGETVHGFICETAGLDGARDITEFGGWRGFLEAGQELR